MRTRIGGLITLASTAALGVVVGAILAVASVSSAASCSSRTLSYGGAPNHVIDGDDYATTFNAGGGEDYIEAKDCDDILNGELGADNLEGDAGFDHVKGQEAGDKPANCGPFACGRVQGGTGTDLVSGGDGSDYVADITGVEDMDGLDGGKGNDTVLGEDGDDRDTVEGGQDDDDCGYDDGDMFFTCENRV